MASGTAAEAEMTLAWRMNRWADDAPIAQRGELKLVMKAWSIEVAALESALASATKELADVKEQRTMIIRLAEQMTAREEEMKKHMALARGELRGLFYESTSVRGLFHWPLNDEDTAKGIAKALDLLELEASAPKRKGKHE